MILNNLNAYLNDDKQAALHIMVASNLSGQAINITQTTAALFRTKQVHKTGFVIFEELLEDLALSSPPNGGEMDLAILAGSVNSVRLKNFPAALDIKTI